jgi:hypothetical protein
MLALKQDFAELVGRQTGFTSPTASGCCGFRIAAAPSGIERRGLRFPEML